MITYKIDPHPSRVLGGWSVIAVHDAQYQREVAWYGSRDRAQNRLDRLNAMMMAERAPEIGGFGPLQHGPDCDADP